MCGLWKGNERSGPLCSNVIVSIQTHTQEILPSRSLKDLEIIQSKVSYKAIAMTAMLVKKKQSGECRVRQQPPVMDKI